MSDFNPFEAFPRHNQRDLILGFVDAEFGWVDLLTIKINRSMASQSGCAGAVLDVC